jgi:AcrR family transcriptional regulator|tara:strand:- start:80 stop:742 length:663 start_codon:yes stop_codon:yes gene_type:complete
LNKHSIELEGKIDGVFEARQDRSRRSRDSFIESGITLLNQMRFNDLKVSDLTFHSGRSVGSFYKRFEDKEAFFRALQAAIVARDKRIIEQRLGKERLNSMSPKEVLDELIDTLVDIFSSEVRGVLRESLLRILEPEDAWAPMRKSGQDIQQRIVDRLKSANPERDEAGNERKLRFCYQVIVGVLQNDLVNDFHTFSTKDRSIRAALKAVVADHMQSSRQY